MQVVTNTHYQTIGGITGAESWKAAGEKHTVLGAQEVEEAQRIARWEARADRVGGKLERCGQ